MKVTSVLKADIDWNSISKKKFLYIPKLESRIKALYFDKSKIKDSTLPHLEKNIINSERGAEKSLTMLNFMKQNRLLLNDEEMDFLNKRDDLLHKKNVECFQEKLKFRRDKSLDIYELTSMIEDMKTEGN